MDHDEIVLKLVTGASLRLKIRAPASYRKIKLKNPTTNLNFCYQKNVFPLPDICVECNPKETYYSGGITDSCVYGYRLGYL